jgi:hypothetical protein
MNENTFFFDEIFNGFLFRMEHAAVVQDGQELTAGMTYRCSVGIFVLFTFVILSVGTASLTNGNEALGSLSISNWKYYQYTVKPGADCGKRNALFHNIVCV